MGGPSPEFFVGERAGFDYFNSEAHHRRIADLVYTHLANTRGIALMAGDPPTVAGVLQSLDVVSAGNQVLVGCVPQMSFAAVRQAYAASRRTAWGSDDQTGAWPQISYSPSAPSATPVILTLENVDLLSEEALAELCGQASIADTRRPPIALAASVDFLTRFTGAFADLLKSPIFAHFGAHRLAADEVAPFIAHQVGAASATEVFRPEIIDLIAAYSDGDPLVVNSLAARILAASGGTNRSLSPPETAIADAKPVRLFSVEASVPSSQLPMVLAEIDGPEPVVPPGAGLSIDDAQTEPLTAAQEPDGSGLMSARDDGEPLSIEHDGVQTVIIPTASPEEIPAAGEGGVHPTAILAAPETRPVAQSATSHMEGSVLTAAGPRHRGRRRLWWIAASIAFILVASSPVLYRFTSDEASLKEPGSRDNPESIADRLPTSVAEPLDQPGKPLPLAVHDLSSAGTASARPGEPESPTVGAGTTTAGPIPAPAVSTGAASTGAPAAADATPAGATPVIPPQPRPPEKAALVPQPSASSGSDAYTGPAGQVVELPPANAMQPASKAKSDDSAATAGGNEAALLVQRGNELLSIGDIVSARNFFERAAATGDSTVATSIAKTYDPLFLQQSGVRGTPGDMAKAMTWYRKAIERGDIEAVVRLKLLQNRYP